MKIQKLRLRENEVIKLKKRVALILMAVNMIAGAATGCTKNDKKPVSDSNPTISAAGSDTAGDVSFASSDVQEVECKPVLEIGNVTGKAGEKVAVDVTLSGAKWNWSFCGIHFSYPDVLKPTIDADTGNIDCVEGEAVADMSDFLAVNWFEDRIPELADNNLNSIFFCTMATDDVGNDGLVATFEFEIPADAQSGTVYDLEFFFREGDMFINREQDTAMQEYAFANWKHGSITVE
ncbi:MAG: hypothetical protein E7499_03945 [Ruminococcus sp.]|nr:hypothetical protein [Ruminococcus sp.]